MAAPSPAGVSKSQVNRSGDLMRSWFTGGPTPGVTERRLALQDITAFRAAHARSLQRVASGLRYYVNGHTAERPITVAQRLKRLHTILDKLCREPDMKLARMHDIGGCRAVVTTEAEIRAIATHLKRRWDVIREYDYIEHPKPESGYRAYHLVVRKDGRLIEVQLRTPRQHAWAELIESVDRRAIAFSLKGGSAPADYTEYYRLGAELLASNDRGIPPDPTTLSRFRELHQQVIGPSTPNV